MSGTDADAVSLPTEKAGEYVVVARRYRPASFEQLIGQQHVARALSRAIETQRVGHAYLFTGARGVGKTSTARILAKALNCVEGPTATPCGVCEICQGVASGDDVDVLEIDGASNRGIDEIRLLRQNANVRPSRARFKIYIIDEVHMLTKEAFNALLKTLEEPPEHVKFIFATTEANKIPITILSRCQRFDFAGIDLENIAKRLREIAEAEGVGLEEEAVLILARRAAGSMRDSQSLLEQLLALGLAKVTAGDVHALLGTAPETRLLSLAEQLSRGNAKEALAELDEAVRQGVEVAQLLDQLLGLFRDVMASAVGCDSRELLHVASTAGAESVAQLGQRLGLETVLAVMQVLEQTSTRMRSSLHGRSLAEMAFVRIAHLERLSDLAGLLEAVQNGEEITVSVPSSGLGGGPATTQSYGSPQLKAEASDSKKNGPVRGEVDSATTSAANDEAEEERAADFNTSLAAAAAERERSVAHKSRPAPARVAANHEPLQDAEPTRKLTAENAEQIWRDALSTLDGVVADQGALCRSVANTAPNHLVVSFGRKYTLYKDLCERPEQKSQLEAALAAVTGTRIRLDFALVEEPADQAPAATKPRSVSLRQVQSEVLGRPLVKRAMELFDVDQPRVEVPEN